MADAIQVFVVARQKIFFAWLNDGPGIKDAECLTHTLLQQH